MGKLRAATLERYKRIIDEWFVNKFNGAAAYRKFYKNQKRDSAARINFSRIQNRPEVKEYISYKHREAAKVVDMTHIGILKELQTLLEMDITEVIGMSKEDLKNVPIGIKRFITGHKERTKYYYDNEGNLKSSEVFIEFKFFAKEKAYEMVAKHIGFYEKDNRQKALTVDISSLTTAELLLRAKLIREITANESE